MEYLAFPDSIQQTITAAGQRGKILSKRPYKPPNLTTNLSMPMNHTIQTQSPATQECNITSCNHVAAWQLMSLGKDHYAYYHSNHHTMKTGFLEGAIQAFLEECDSCRSKVPETIEKWRQEAIKDRYQAALILYKNRRARLPRPLFGSNNGKCLFENEASILDLLKHMMEAFGMNALKFGYSKKLPLIRAKRN